MTQTQTADGMISEEEFDQDWGAHAQEDGSLFEHEDAVKMPPNQVWTVVEGEDGSWIAQAGFWIVNKVGYVFTSKPWDNEHLCAEWFPALKDDDEFDEDDDSDE